MNKISMDAMNASWAVGFGTKVPHAERDFDLLVARRRNDMAPVAVAKPKSMPFGLLSKVADMIATLSLHPARL